MSQLTSVVLREDEELVDGKGLQLTRPTVCDIVKKGLPAHAEQKYDRVHHRRVTIKTCFET